MLESPVVLRRGRDLVSAELFEKVSEFCAEEYGHELSTARRIVDQALAFLKVMGDTRAFDMTPSCTVDPGWHSFVLHTQAYAAWCDEQFGFFLGHEPKATVREVDEATWRGGPVHRVVRHDRRGHGRNSSGSRPIR
ncbi:hypothetical protein ACFV6Z_32370 [Streptomyces sp. NPDC059818]|uniref:hypothetical protein n=1 Tax=Streptomyces sp. NPDC059818 TaxID=3346962 RepID=UPI00365971C2